MAQSLSYVDAVRILGGQDRSTTGRLISLLDGVLTAAVGGAVASVGRDLLQSLRSRPLGAMTRAERNKRFEAAHAVLVVTAYFDALAEADLPIPFAELSLSDQERAILAGGRAGTTDTPLGWLLTVPAPPPSPSGPSTDDLARLWEHYAVVSGRVESFVSGLAAWDGIGEGDRRRFLDGLKSLPEDACERYIELQIQLAYDVPEWNTWAAAQEKKAALVAARAGMTASEPRVTEDATSSLDWAEDLREWYRVLADEPLVELEDMPDGLNTPTLREGFVERTMSSLVGDQERRFDAIDLLTSRLQSPEAGRSPIVISAADGDGKSTLLRMLASRLAEGSRVRPVLVDGTQVSAFTTLQRATERAVEEITGWRPGWSSIVGEVSDWPLVLLVDGLTGTIRGGELYRAIAAFQAEQISDGSRVHVVLTGSHEVADRGAETNESDTWVMEPLNQSQVQEWVAKWNSANITYFRYSGLEPLPIHRVPDFQNGIAKAGVLAQLAVQDAIDNKWQLADRKQQDQLLRRWAAQQNQRPIVEYAGYVPDAAEGGEDLLGIADDVTTLSHVLLAEDASPPISVGLFGEWGTGKSFFMDKMRSTVDDVAKAARQARLEGESTGFCGEVRQITFNAWHYMDASLWATLADTIFDGLTRDEGEGGTSPEGRVRILAELESVRLIRRELNRERDEAQRHLDAASESLREQPIGLVDVVRTAPVKRYTTKLTTDVEQKLTARLKEAGLEESEIKDLRDLTALGTLRQIGVLVRRGTNVTRLVLVVALAVALLGLGGLATFAVNRSTDAIAWGLGSAAGLLAALVVVQRYVGKMRGVVKVAAEIVDAVDEQRAAPVRAQQDSLRRMIARYEEQIVAADARIKLLDTGRSALAFAHIRHAAGDYKRHEGVVSLVRRDLEQLSRLMTERRSDDYSSMPELERIILYVDDLDRCPADRVMEVLQAIHLLLAFPLFVVVVGVDLRWLLRAVQRHLRELGGDDGQVATPFDYLEKIFQLPFCLQPMTAPGYERLIEQLVSVDPATRVREEPSDVALPAFDERLAERAQPVSPPRRRRRRPQTGRRLAVYGEGVKPMAMALVRGGTAVVWIDDAGQVWSRDVRTGRPSPAPLTVDAPTRVLATSDGYFFVGQEQGRIVLVDGATPAIRRTMAVADPEEPAVPSVIAALPDASAAVVAWALPGEPARHSFVAIDDTVADPIPLYPPANVTRRVWLLSPGWRLADDDGRPALAAAGEGPRSGPLLDAEIKDAVLSDDSRYLAVIDAENQVHAWRLDGQADQLPVPSKIPLASAQPADLLAIDRTGRLAIARDTRVELWSLVTGDRAGEVVTRSTVRSIALAADGRRLVTACEDGSVEVWLVVTERETRRPTASALRMTVGERNALIAVGRLITTPRAAKRMVNSYRLLRSGLGPQELDRLVDSPHSYGAVVVLLGLLVGWPTEGTRILERLLSDHAEVSGPLEGLLKYDPRRLSAVIRSVGAPSEAEAYRRWAPLVARFSFRTGAMQQEPTSTT